MYGTGSREELRTFGVRVGAFERLTIPQHRPSAYGDKTDEV